MLPSPNVGEGPGMRVSFLPFGKVGNNNCPTIGLPTKKGDNRVSPFHHVPLTLPSPPGEGVLPSPNVGEGPGMRVSFLPFGKVGNNNCPTIGLPTKKGDNRVSPFYPKEWLFYLKGHKHG